MRRWLLFPLLTACTTNHSNKVQGDAVEVNADGAVDASTDVNSDAPVDARVYPASPQRTFSDPSALHPDVTLHVPTTYDPTRAYPLVIFLHGYNGSAAAYAGWSPIMAKDILYFEPIGALDSYRQHYWNASTACCNRDHRSNDDVAYLGGLIDRAAAAGWHIDERYVVVVGASNGGFMAERLACDRADIVTAIVDFAGATRATADAPCVPTGKIPALVDHSHGDQTIRWAGGTIFGLATYPAAEGTVDSTTARGNCTPLSPIGSADHDPAVAGAETTVSTADCDRGALTLWEETASAHYFTPTATWGEDVWTWISANPRTAFSKP